MSRVLETVLRLVKPVPTPSPHHAGQDRRESGEVKVSRDDKDQVVQLNSAPLPNMASFMSPLFDKVSLLKNDPDDPEAAPCLPCRDCSDQEEEEEEEEVPASCATPAGQEERDPLGHMVSAHTIADI
ncbi:Hypp9144 [Branchiostoma lanceolatum]|uniref:Hypp9144 protein n=1 Tax=Branchiostoma lanceolatum TaxID=7740 RepID=A0A8J9ZEM8_BRALA|nr:Hypp9144 [Branchiostoma lanceolatum]